MSFYYRREGAALNYRVTNVCNLEIALMRVDRLVRNDYETLSKCGQLHNGKDVNHGAYIKTVPLSIIRLPGQSNRNPIPFYMTVFYWWKYKHKLC